MKSYRSMFVALVAAFAFSSAAAADIKLPAYQTITLDNGWDSLKPYRIAFINGWKMFEANAQGARVVNKVDKPEQLFRMLDEGRVDLVLYTHADGLLLARNLGLTSVAPLSPALKEVDMYLYLHKKHQALVPKLTQAIRDLKADGSYNRILSAIY